MAAFKIRSLALGPFVFLGEENNTAKQQGEHYYCDPKLAINSLPLAREKRLVLSPFLSSRKLVPRA